VSDWKAADAYRDDNGVVSLEAVAFDSSGQYTYHFESTLTENSRDLQIVSSASVPEDLTQPAPEVLERVSITSLPFSEEVSDAALNAISDVTEFDPIYFTCQTKKIANNIGVFWAN